MNQFGKRTHQECHTRHAELAVVTAAPPLLFRPPWLEAGRVPLWPKHNW